jgi:peroxiredoxin
MPWFVEFERTYKNRGLAVIGVSLDDVWPVAPPAIFMDTTNIDYPLVVGSKDLAGLYGVTSLPTSLLIDREGKITARHVGIVSRSVYENEIIRLLGK